MNASHNQRKKPDSSGNRFILSMLIFIYGFILSDCCGFRHAIEMALIGILMGAIVLAVILTIYLRGKSNQSKYMLFVYE